MTIWEPLKQLSDRTPLRTKLITAVLALVIMALAAISITSVVVLRSTCIRSGTLSFRRCSATRCSEIDSWHPGHARFPVPRGDPA